MFVLFQTTHDITGHDMKDNDRIKTMREVIMGQSNPAEGYVEEGGRDFGKDEKVGTRAPFLGL